ncbi:MAG: thioredoxin family protein, partial [Candidatus Binatia bacterium]
MGAAAWIAWPAATTAAGLVWQPYSAQALAQAARAGRPAFVDFRADWCLPCLEMERTTFLAPEVTERAGRFVMLQADVTEMSEDQEEWLSRHEVLGVPSTLFFDPAGREVRRMVGFIPATDFAASLETAVGSARTANGRCGGGRGIVSGRHLLHFTRAAALAAIVPVSAVPASAGTDFEPRPVVAHFVEMATDGGPAGSTVIGIVRPYTFREGDTLYDVARRAGLGINELRGALPDVDVWLPPAGETVELPTSWIVPRTEPKGVVINVPEMRLYYFPPASPGAASSGPSRISTVITYPIGLGRGDWQTPLGSFRITEKTENPTWVIPESIREERIREKGRHERSIAGGDPENPLGRYRMRTTVDLYGIHG